MKNLWFFHRPASVSVQSPLSVGLFGSSSSFFSRSMFSSSSSSSLRFRGVQVILFSFFSLLLALANQVDTWVRVIFVMMASMIFSPLVGYGFFPVLAKPSFQSGCGVPGSILAVSWVSIRVRAQGSSVRMIPYRSGHACRVVIRRALQGAKPMVLLAKDHFMDTCAQCRIGYRSLTQTHINKHTLAHTHACHMYTL